MALSKVFTAMIEQPMLAILPFLALLAGGMHWNIGMLGTLAFLYQGAWCTYRHKRCGTLQCGITGPLYLLIALFSLLGRLPIFSTSSHHWSSWDHLFLVFWLGTTAAFAAQWLSTRRRLDLALAGIFLLATAVVYAAF